jgi:hypothetical protein
MTLLSLGVFVVYVVITFGQSQRINPTARKNQASPVPTPAVVSSLYCGSCHEHPQYDANQNPTCRVTEYATWKSQDRHQIAYEALLTPRGEQTAKQLNVDSKEHGNACVRCHGIVVAPGVQQLQFDPKQDGVTFVACHGTFLEWIREHQFPNSPRWRKLTRAQIEQLKRLRDLCERRTRVETCRTYHVGDPDTRKILTHEMYAFRDDGPAGSADWSSQFDL